MSNALPDWLEPVFARLADRYAAGRFPHALLVTGPAGVGKRLLSQALLARLVCETAGAQPACGQCRGCRLFSSGNHPDVRTVRPDEGKQMIRIDQIRELGEFLVLNSQYRGYRPALIDPADQMNVNAANALLKTLEEPPSTAVLILVSDRPSSLPATIRSRCQMISIPVPTRDVAERWLREQAVEQPAKMLDLALGAPLRARQYAEENRPAAYETLLGVLVQLRRGQQGPVAAATEWKGQLTMLLELAVQAVAEAIRTLSAPNRMTNELHPAFDGLDLMALHGYLDRLFEARGLIAHPLNEQLAIEKILIDWIDVCRRSAGSQQYVRRT